MRIGGQFYFTIYKQGLLLQLEAQGFVELPPRKKNPPNPLLRPPTPEIVEVDQTPIECKLSDLRPIELLQVRRTAFQKLYNSLIDQYHYLRYTRPVGEHWAMLGYGVRQRKHGIFFFFP